MVTVKFAIERKKNGQRECREKAWSRVGNVNQRKSFGSYSLSHSQCTLNSCRSLLVVFISKGFRFSKSARVVSQSLQLYEEIVLISSISCSQARPSQLCEVRNVIWTLVQAAAAQELIQSIWNQVGTKNNQGVYHLRVFPAVRQGNVAVKDTQEWSISKSRDQNK